MMPLPNLRDTLFPETVSLAESLIDLTGVTIQVLRFRCLGVPVFTTMALGTLH